MLRQSVTERRKQATRDEIAAAALMLFSRHGYDDVGADDIAAEAGVSLRTFYRYFSGKNETLAPIITSGTADIVGLIAARPAGEPLAVAVRHAFQELSSAVGPDQVHVLTSLLVSVPDLRARWLDDLRAIEEQLLTVVQARSAGVSKDQARLTAAAIVAALRLTLEGGTTVTPPGPLAATLGKMLRYLADGAGL